MSRKLLAALCAPVFAALSLGLSGCHYHGGPVTYGHQHSRAAAMHYHG